MGNFLAGRKHQKNKYNIEEICYNKNSLFAPFLDGKGSKKHTPERGVTVNGVDIVFKNDEGKTAYIFGGLAVNPEFRGKGINPRIVSTMIKGLKHYSAAYPNLHIGGAGFEISCENFANLRSK